MNFIQAIDKEVKPELMKTAVLIVWDAVLNDFDDAVRLFIDNKLVKNYADIPIVLNNQDYYDMIKPYLKDTYQNMPVKDLIKTFMDYVEYNFKVLTVGAECVYDFVEGYSDVDSIPFLYKGVKH